MPLVFWTCISARLLPASVSEEKYCNSSDVLHETPDKLNIVQFCFCSICVYFQILSNEFSLPTLADTKSYAAAKRVLADCKSQLAFFSVLWSSSSRGSDLTLSNVNSCQLGDICRLICKENFFYKSILFTYRQCSFGLCSYSWP